MRLFLEIERYYLLLLFSSILRLKTSTISPKNFYEYLQFRSFVRSFDFSATKKNDHSENKQSYGSKVDFVLARTLLFYFPRFPLGMKFL